MCVCVLFFGLSVLSDSALSLCVDVDECDEVRFRATFIGPCVYGMVDLGERHLFICFV